MYFTDLTHKASVFLRAVNTSSTISTSNSTAVTTSSIIPESTVANTILVVAADKPSAQAVTLGLDGYGIPHQELYVPQNGTALPSLNDTATQGNFGGIVVVSEVGYQYSTGWFSALTENQWNTMYNYQANFGVRMVRLNVYPGPAFGATTAINGAGCCDTGVEQLLSITDTSAFPTANIKTNAPVSTEGLWHYPALITNSSIATEIAQFAPSGSFTNTTTAAVINNFGTRQQMVWFISWSPDWSATSSYLQHSYIHWITRGVFVGKRKVYLNTQVDDVHLETDIYYPNGTTFRLRPGDLDALVPWMANLNKRLPAGSNYIMELGHNGNGNIENATDDSRSLNICNPDAAVEYDQPPDTPLEWIKPLGTGTNLWDPTWISYNWSLSCAQIDALASWFTVPANRDAFSHVSHTFTHEEVDNATYYDCVHEIQWNRAWLKEVGIDQAARYSTNGLIPPAITGLHNGDALQAWMDNGIQYVVGDNTRPVLRNPNSTFWPLYTNVAENGYAGMLIVPRWATTIYYNCWSADCTLLEWINTSTAASGNFTDLLANALATNTRYLLGLQPDPYMFHQANLRNIDMPEFTVGDQTAKFSLIQIWVETIAQEMIRLTNWPITSLKHDDIAKLFLDRMTLDTTCNPNLSYQISADGTAIAAVTVTTTNNVCSVPVPVTLAQTATTTANATSDLLGSEPLIMWVTMNGSPVTLTFSTPVPL